MEKYRQRNEQQNLGQEIYSRPKVRPNYQYIDYTLLLSLVLTARTEYVLMGRPGAENFRSIDFFYCMMYNHGSFLYSCFFSYNGCMGGGLCTMYSKCV